MTILKDSSKFVQFGPIDNFDSTLSIETMFQKSLVKWVESRNLLTDISNLIRPPGSIHPRLYGLHIRLGSH